MSAHGERTPQQRALDAALRNHFPTFLHKAFRTLNLGQAFVPEWYLSAIAHQLDRVRRGECRRLIINLPPRSLKSITVSTAWPAFRLGHDPTLRIICASYSQDLANKLSNDTRALLNADWYRQLFPDTRIGGKDSQGEVELTRRGSRVATSVGGTLTGRGGNLLIVDDPLKPGDAHSDPARSAANEWFNSTLLSRLDDKRHGAIVIVMQRLHMDDLTGFLLRRGEGWEVLCLPAVATVDQETPLLGGKSHHRRVGDLLSRVREPLPVLEELKRQQGSDLFSAQYQQEPVPPGGNMIKRHWVQRYVVLPSRDECWGCLQSWDTASKGGPDNDFSVCTTWLQARDKRWYLAHVWRDRVDYPTLKARVVELAERYRPSKVLVEDSGTATGLLAELRGVVSGLVGVKPDKDNISRLSQVSAQFEAGEIVLPEQAPWLPDLEAELFSFPGSVHDDQVDSISQALMHGRTDMEIWERLAEGYVHFGQHMG